MVGKDIITQSKLIELVQGAIDIAFTRTTDPAARSSKTELRVDPAAYMATRPDHDDDGVEGSEEEEAKLLDVEPDTQDVSQVICKAIRNPMHENLKLRVVNVYEDPGIWIVLDE